MQVSQSPAELVGGMRSRASFGGGCTLLTPSGLQFLLLVAAARRGRDSGHASQTRHHDGRHGGVGSARLSSLPSCFAVVPQAKAGKA